MPINGVDLFCGAGGSSLGARAAGVAMVGAVDAWGLATATYADNFPTAAGNVVTGTLGADASPASFRGLPRVDLLLASPECTHHSIARGAKSRDEASLRSGLHVIPFAKALAPRWVVIENVTQMRSWEGYGFLVSGLKSLGYGVTEQVLNASDFGVPQSRRRLFLLCDRDGTPSPVPVVASASRRHASEVVDPVGTWVAKPVHAPGRAASTIARFETGQAALGRGKDFLVVYYGSDKCGGWQPLDRPLRTLTTLDRFGLVQWVDDVPTLRMLQVDEIRRAMGVEGLRLGFGNRRDRIKLLGNGVCAPVMEAVVSSLTRRIGLLNAA